MSAWNDLAHWLYGDARSDRGFWYAHPLGEIDGLSHEQLFWTPDAKNLCTLWHVGHIAHRERTHIGRFLQGLEGRIIPPPYEVFGTDWRSVDDVRDSVDSVGGVLDWVEAVRRESVAFVQSLSDDDWHKVPPTSDQGLTAAHWVFITVSHGALHIGKIQLLRAMLEGTADPPC